MKRLIWLFAAIAALVPVSCEKEPIDGKGNDTSSSPSTSDVFYSVVSQLVNKNELVGDYSQKTFQPSIGIADGGDESVRVVATNSLEAAVNRYNTLTGASIDTNTVSHTFSDKAVGTLTWSKNTDNKAFGTVTVNIPSVPTLQKIIYRAGDQGDTNGTFGVNGKATAYYRFGDVIKRTRDDFVVEYWVCVRPAFTYEEKEKSHWISVSPLPKEKLWEYYDTGKPFTASNGMDYSLPWKIGTDLEWHQDLAEMLFAIMYPEDWATNIQNYSSLSMFGRPSGLPIFNDWHCDNIKYHNKYFWENVQKAWKINSIVEKVFGVSFDEMKALLKQPNANGQGGGPGLYLLYDGSYWSTRFSNKPNLYQVHYFHGTKDTKKNMHEKDTDKPCSQVVVPKNLTEGANNYPLDFYKSMTVQKPYIKEQRFFGDDQPRWVVRYAEGKELTDGVYDPMQVMSGFEGDYEVYRYYRDVKQRNNLADEPEIPQLENGNSNNNNNNLPPGTTGFFFPGTVIQDEKGVNWVCYTGWLNYPDLGVSKDRKARFFTTKGLTTKWDGAGSTFINEDLPPLNEAITLAFLLESIKQSGGSGDDQLYNSIKEYLEFNWDSFETIRDSLFLYEGQRYSSNIRSTSLLYRPTGGKAPGTQPYLRYVWDGTWCGEAREKVPKEKKYPYVWFYTKYNDSKADPMDLAHLLSTSNYVTADRPIPSDLWSRCKHHQTDYRDGAFTKDMLYHSTVIDMLDFMLGTNKNAYHDPVKVFRYLELDDDVQAFKGTYGDQKYTLVYDAKPNKMDQVLMRLSEQILRYGFVRNTNNDPKRCTLDGEAYTMDLFTQSELF